MRGRRREERGGEGRRGRCAELLVACSHFQYTFYTLPIHILFSVTTQRVKMK